MNYDRLEHRFVENIPDLLDSGVLYVSMEYATAAHSCCCGCGEEVITPFSPTDWKMTFDGETITLWPSIGNWSFPCRSHYIIKQGKAIEALPWSADQVSEGRQRDRNVKRKFFEQPPQAHLPPEPTTLGSESKGFWTRLRGRLFGREI